MRCLSLSKVLEPLFPTIVFICCDLSGNVSKRVLEQGYHLEMIPNTTDFSNDASFVEEILSQFDSVDLLIVDHYALDKAWEQSMSRCVNKLMVIDDLSREHICDIFLDQNSLGEKASHYKNKLPETCLNLLGPQYALLRSQFSNRKPTSLKKIEQVEKILLFMGGADDCESTLRLLQILSKLIQEGCHFEVKVVCSDSNKQIKKIKVLCEKVSAFNMQCFTPDMATLISDSDVCIGASGSTTWERCCLGKSSFVITFADNHKKIAKDGFKAGFHSYCGDIRTISDSEIKGRLSSYLANVACINQQSERAWRLVDGKGVLRVRDSIAKVCGL